MVLDVCLHGNVRTVRVGWCSSALAGTSCTERALLSLSGQWAGMSGGEYVSPDMTMCGPSEPTL
jgi:hypothetical protein